MSNWLMLRTNTLWRICLVGIALWAVPSCLFGQRAPFLERAHSSTSQPFAGFDDSLTIAADTLLVSADQINPPATSRTILDQPPSTGLSIQDDQLIHFSSVDGRSAAAIRLNLLRPVVEPILTSHSVPADLAAVILVESGGRAIALSPKGARGLWQLMPDTARRYGLRVDAIQDDRIDPVRATYAAARYLHDLYVQFGDWKLALAAYNTGEANVGSAILRAHTQNFDQLTNLRMLPLETRDYVPAVMAAIRSSGSVSVLNKNRKMPSQNTIFAVSSQ